MHPFPAPDPLPVADVALIAVDNVGRAFGFAMRHQCRQDSRRLGMDVLALTGVVHREAFLDKARVVLPTHKTVRVHHGLMEGNVGSHTDDAVLLQRTPHPQDGLGTRFAPHDEFGNHRVIKSRDLKTWIDSSVYTYARTGGQETVCNAPSRRQEVVVWILCVDPTLNGMPIELYVLLLVAQRTPARYPDLLLDNINTRHHFRHRVLHLQARV